jgi:O-antigen/teichoic acid export membrane protein
VGEIKRQSISGTIYSYIGVVLGFIITAVLYTRALDTEQVGLLRVMVSYATLFAQFASLGINAVSVRMFPYFRNSGKKHHGFLGLALLVSIVGFVLAAIVFLLLRPYVVEQAQDKSELFIEYFYYVVPLIFFTLIFNVFDTYYRVLYNAVKGILVKEVIQRIGILISILLYFYGYISFHEMVLLYIAVMISPSVILFFSLLQTKQLYLKPDFNFLNRDLKKEMLSVGFYGILASFSGILVMNIDVLMINDMLGLKAAGIYTVTFYFGTLILVPLRTMGKISSVVISDAWKKNDLETIADIYKRSSLSLSVVGILLFIGIWGNIDNVFHIISDDYLPGKMVIFYIGIANLFDIALGVSPHIIVNSKYYKYLSYFMVVFAIFLILTNLLLIPEFGIVGAAIASLVSKFLFNGIKFLFLYRKFRFQPFDMKFPLLIIISILSYWISAFIPPFSNFILDIIIRSVVITLLFGVPVYFFRISEDINGKVNDTLLKLKARI